MRVDQSLTATVFGELLSAGDQKPRLGLGTGFRALGIKRLGFRCYGFPGYSNDSTVWGLRLERFGALRFQ